MFVCHSSALLTIVFSLTLISLHTILALLSLNFRLNLTKMKTVLQLLFGFLLILIYTGSHRTESGHSKERRHSSPSHTHNGHRDTEKEARYLEKLDRKILKKIAKKKALMDSFLGHFLGILEIKKKLLFKLWKKKNSKKKKNNKHFNDQLYYIPYYNQEQPLVKNPLSYH